jgi:predicted nucleic acid-binding Zn finger protein
MSKSDIYTGYCDKIRKSDEKKTTIENFYFKSNRFLKKFIFDSYYKLYIYNFCVCSGYLFLLIYWKQIDCNHNYSLKLAETFMVFQTVEQS